MLFGIWVVGSMCKTKADVTWYVSLLREYTALLIPGDAEIENELEWLGSYIILLCKACETAESSTYRLVLIVVSLCLACAAGGVACETGTEQSQDFSSTTKH